jgi:acetylornithine deacetylase/succinyl-diaminopimelate desuccinylase-like protein
LPKPPSKDSLISPCPLGRDFYARCDKIALTASDIVQTVSRQAELLLGSAPEIIGQAWWCDSALLAAAGIPTVIFGPGGTGAHATVEWADLEQLQRCSDVLIATVREFCA